MQFYHAVRRDKIIRTIGLDADVCVAFVLRKGDFSMSIPKMLIRKEVYVNYVILRQVFGVLVHKKKKSREEANKMISKFLDRYKIRKIEKKGIDETVVNHYLDKLKKHREIIQSIADDDDLMIISIYKTKGIDCILTRNTSHHYDAQ